MHGNSNAQSGSFAGMFSLQWAVDEEGYVLSTLSMPRASSVLLGVDPVKQILGIDPAAQLSGVGEEVARIQRRGGKLRRYFPATRGPLHREFAKVKTPEDALLFVSTHGLLFTSPKGGKANSLGSSEDGDLVEAVLDLAKGVRHALRLISEYRKDLPTLFPLLNGRLAPRLTVEFDFERDSLGNPKPQRPVLRVVPYTLAGFIWLQVAE